jgi:hypothetical protein
MAAKTDDISNAKTPAKNYDGAPAKKNYRALCNILGDQVGVDADLATRSIAPNKLYRKGSIIPLSEKDAMRLLKIKAVEPIK